MKFLHIINRAVAKKIGIKRYFTGKPCKYGHSCERFVSGQCVICASESLKKYQNDNREKINEYARKRAKKHAAKINAYRDTWAAKNPDKIKAYAKTHKTRHRESINAKNANRRAMIRLAEGSFTPKQIQEKINYQRGRCANCTEKLLGKYHIDHVMPLSKGGSNYITNIEILCPGCNIAKSARLPEEWAKRNGRLL